MYLGISVKSFIDELNQAEDYFLFNYLLAWSKRKLRNAEKNTLSQIQELNK